MDDAIILEYIGNRDGNERYLSGYPKGNITRSALAEIARSRGETPAEAQRFLLSYPGMWQLRPDAESATIEEPVPAPAAVDGDSFREEPTQTPGEAAPAQ